MLNIVQRLFIGHDTAVESRNITFPLAVTEGNLIFVLGRTGPARAATIADFTNMAYVDAPSGWGRLSAHYKVAGASEPATYAFLTGTTSATENAIIAYEISGDFDATTPVTLRNSLTGGTWGGDPQILSGATAQGDLAVIGVTGLPNAADVSVVGFTEQGQTYRFWAGDEENQAGGTLDAQVSLGGAFSESHAVALYTVNNAAPAVPTISDPTATSITQTTATIGCTTDDATGTLYGVVTTSATPPSEAQVAAGQDHTGATAAASGTNASLSVGANTINVTGLTADTTYYSHFVQDIGTAEYSNVLSSTSWNTLEAVNSPTISAGAITNRAVDGFTIGFTTDTANGTAYYAVYTTSTARNAATAQDIVDESTSLDAAVAAGSKAVTVAEAQTFTAVSGLDPDTPYYVAIVHYGDAQA